MEHGIGGTRTLALRFFRPAKEWRVGWHGWRVPDVFDGRPNF